MTRSTALIALVSLTACPAFAQEQGFSGEGSFSAGYTTGNTETTDLGLAVKLANTVGLWTTGVEAAADYGETDEVETKNRVFLAANLDRQLGDRLFAFGQTSYEKDEFSGFDSRIFAGGGLGYQIIESEPTVWSVRAGPGYKRDEVKAYSVMRNGMPRVIPATTEQSFSFLLGSEFSHQFNEAVTFTNTSDAVYGAESTQISNIIALTASLTDRFSARVSFEVRHDTNPPSDFEATDTATRLSIVYALGE